MILDWIQSFRYEMGNRVYVQCGKALLGKSETFNCDLCEQLATFYIASGLMAFSFCFILKDHSILIRLYFPFCI